MSDLEESIDNILDEVVEQEGGFAEGGEQPSEEVTEPPVESGYEADNEESDEKAKPQRKKRSKYKSYVSDLKQEFYREKNLNAQLQAQLAAMHEEKEKYREYFQKATHNAMDHYESAARQNQLAAELAQKQAIESGDVEAQVQAATNLAVAVQEHQAALKLKADAQLQQQRDAQEGYAQPMQQVAPTPQAPSYEHREYLTQAWSKANSWIEDDPELLDKVRNFANAYNEKLTMNGAQAWINSPEYFSVLDEMIERETRNRPYYEPQSKGNAPMKNNLNMNRSYAAAPTNRYAGSQNSGRVARSTPALTDAEKWAAEYFWHESPEEYQKTLASYTKKQAQNKQKDGFFFGTRRGR